MEQAKKNKEADEDVAAKRWNEAKRAAIYLEVRESNFIQEHTNMTREGFRDMVHKLIFSPEEEVDPMRRASLSNLWGRCYKTVERMRDILNEEGKELPRMSDPEMLNVTPEEFTGALAMAHLCAQDILEF